MSKRWIAALVLLAGCAQRPREPLARAAGYLWKQQAADGGWHSHTYGLLRSGQSMTPFVLLALLNIPESVYRRPASKVLQAVEFLKRNTATGGMAGLMDPTIPDYPNYSTALAVSALSRARVDGWQRIAAPMVEALRRQQFSEQNGWKREDPAYGAWGMGGEPRTPPDAGHVDLSMTRYVLEALRAAGVPASDPVIVRARVFVERCQNFDSDGGFFFATTEFDTNKAGHDGKRFRSYGTTTADGILALLAVGTRVDDARVAAAQRWMVDRHRGMDAPGFSGEAYQRWPQGLSFYYAATSTHAFQALGVPVDQFVKQRLLAIQRIDGSWANPENLVKEDDPLIATAFAVHALSGDLATPGGWAGKR